MFPISANRSMNEQRALRGESGVSVAGARDIRRIMNTRGFVDGAQASSFLGASQDVLNAHERSFVVATEEVDHGPFGRVKWYSLTDLRLLKARRDLAAAGRRPL